VRGRRGRVVAAGDAEPLPLAVGAAELLAGLTGRRALGVIRALVGAGVLRRRVLHPEREKGAAEHRDQRESAFHGGILLSWIPKDDDNKRRASRSARDRERESCDLRRFDVTFFREAVEVAPAASPEYARGIAFTAQDGIGKGQTRAVPGRCPSDAAI